MNRMTRKLYPTVAVLLTATFATYANAGPVDCARPAIGTGETQACRQQPGSRRTAPIHSAHATHPHAVYPGFRGRRAAELERVGASPTALMATQNISYAAAIALSWPRRTLPVAEAGSAAMMRISLGRL